MGAQTTTASGSAEQHFLNQGGLLKRYGISRTTLWTWRRKGLIPPPVELAPGIERWRESDLQQWEAQRAAARSKAAA